MHGPFVDVDELRLRRMLGEIAQQQSSLRHAPAADDAGVRGEIERLAAMHRMGPHQALQHRLEELLFLVGVIEEPERAARIHQRVLADQVVDLSLGLVVERIIGRAHVGELRVAALRVHHAGRQQRKFRGDRAERTVGMPEAVAEIEQMLAMILRQRLAVLVKVGDVVEA